MRQVFDGDPMELDILAHSDVSGSSGILFRQISNGAQLVRVDEPIGETNTQHEIRHCFAFATAAAQRSSAIALRVNAPPAEVCLDPLIRDCGVALCGELADFVEAFPGILLLLKPFGPLGFCFLYRCYHGCAHLIHLKLSWPCKCGKKQKAHRLLWRWACFPKVMNALLGSSFSGQRQTGRHATTHTHALAHQLHISKIYAAEQTVKK